ncbi:imelysin family protein [Mangrovimonas aestuarii]|uniref:imelysin family protein n=1 Tax=Mangrovimonas aestuarii TaxID=3018443 RepID=UPI002379C25E|nr:imelysin family protein [Mangrovimonas aestuarii]
MKYIFSLLAVALILVGCDSDSGSGGANNDGYDRSLILANLADNIIIPAYEDFGADITALKSAAESFVATPDQTNLNVLRTAWFEAYKTWQYVAMYDLGKAYEVQLGYQMNVFPTSVEEIESNVNTGTYDLGHSNNHDAVGFPALDYLLYGVATDEASILAKYTTDPLAENYQDYLIDLVNRMDELTQPVVANWPNYRNEFVSNDGNTINSSLNKVMNDYIAFYETGLRKNKIGYPAGVWTTSTYPEKVEGYYSGTYSKELALVALKAVEDVFNGNHYNENGTGESLKTYLDYLNEIKNGTDLSVLINNQFTISKDKINVLNDNFFTQISTNNTLMLEAYDELQKNVILMKVDMLQSFNISVDYVDSDGD